MVPSNCQEPRELSDVELQKEWRDLVVEETGEEPGDRNLLKPMQGWSKWKSNKIWVENGTDQSIAVYVDRLHKVADLLKIGGALGANATGAQIEAHLEQQTHEARVQVEVLTPKTRQLFELGSASGGGYVTAAIKADVSQVFCRDKLVSAGYLLIVEGETFNIFPTVPAP